MSVFALNGPAAFAAGTQQSAYPANYFYGGFGITVRPTSVNPNGTVTVTGQGFTPNGAVDVSTSNQSSFTITADERGNITAEFTAPSIPNQYTVTAEDSSTAQYASATYRVYGAVVRPRVSVSPTAVNPVTNANFSINGAGFTPDTTVTFSVTGNITLTPASTTTDAFGNFGTSVTATFTIPGRYRVTVVDGATGIATSTTLTVR
jgi:hypothetical protein